MKIFSKFKDYYDSVQSFGQDDTIHFVRNEEQLEISKDLVKKVIGRDTQLSLKYETIDDERRSIGLTKFMILFCGKIYKGYRVSEYSTYQGRYIFHRYLDGIFYNYDDTIEFYNKYEEDLSKYNRRWFEGEINDWFKHTENNLEDFSIDNKIVLAYLDPQFQIKNCSLQDLEFYKIVDSFSAYQELDMYISGVLSKDANMMIEIADKDKIPQHGFDNFSFKKLPTKNRNLDKSK